MRDATTNGAPRDVTCVALSNDLERDYWTNRFGVSEEQLRAAVERVGTSVDAVAEWLNQ